MSSLPTAIGAKDDNPQVDVEATGSQPIDSENVNAQDLGREIGDVIDAVKQLTHQTKDEYARHLDDRLQKLDARIVELRGSATELKADAKARLETQIETLREKKESVAQRLQELKSSSGDAWQEMQSGLNVACDEL